MDFRCRDGAGADGIRVRTSASTAEPGPGRIFDADTLARCLWTPNQFRRVEEDRRQNRLRPDAPRPDGSAVSLRPKRMPSARAALPGRRGIPDTPPAFRPDADPPASRLDPERLARIPLFGRRRTPATDANRCHTDANHCHSAPMADQSARETLSSLPEP